MEATLELQRRPASREAASQWVPVEPAAPRPPSHEMVARRAYEIWQRHGCPSGTEFHDWLAAEAELRSVR